MRVLVPAWMPSQFRARAGSGEKMKLLDIGGYGVVGGASVDGFGVAEEEEEAGESSRAMEMLFKRRQVESRASMFAGVRLAGLDRVAW
jgi:hypothetical protein